MSSVPPPQRAPRLLIVDPDKPRCRLYEKLFQAEGYHVDTISNPSAVLAGVRDATPDLIIMTVTMPGTSGFELCSDLRMQDETQLTSIILVTSSRTEENDVVRGLLCGADDYVTSPNRLHELRARARVQLRNHRDRERLRWARQQRSRFRTEAMLDPLTGISNRRAAEIAVESAILSGDPVMLMMLDVDRFKQINDTYGHPTGDLALTTLAKRLDKLARCGDVVARYGGEEFLILIHGSSPSIAPVIAERFRAGIEMMEVPEIHGGLTISIGVSSWDGTGATPSSQLLIRIADEALYKAKEAGRNTVFTSIVGVHNP